MHRALTVSRPLVIVLALSWGTNPLQSQMVKPRKVAGREATTGVCSHFNRSLLLNTRNEDSLVARGKEGILLQIEKVGAAYLAQRTLKVDSAARPNDEAFRVVSRQFQRVEKKLAELVGAGGIARLAYVRKSLRQSPELRPFAPEAVEALLTSSEDGWGLLQPKDTASVDSLVRETAQHLLVTDCVARLAAIEALILRPDLIDRKVSDPRVADCSADCKSEYWRDSFSSVLATAALGKVTNVPFVAIALITYQQARYLDNYDRCLKSCAPDQALKDVERPTRSNQPNAPEGPQRREDSGKSGKNEGSATGTTEERKTDSRPGETTAKENAPSKDNIRSPAQDKVIEAARNVIAKLPAKHKNESMSDQAWEELQVLRLKRLRKSLARQCYGDRSTARGMFDTAGAATPENARLRAAAISGAFADSVENAIERLVRLESALKARGIDIDESLARLDDRHNRDLLKKAVVTPQLLTEAEVARLQEIKNEQAKREGSGVSPKNPVTLALDPLLLDYCVNNWLKQDTASKIRPRPTASERRSR